MRWPISAVAACSLFLIPNSAGANNLIGYAVFLCGDLIDGYDALDQQDQETFDWGLSGVIGGYWSGRNTERYSQGEKDIKDFTDVNIAETAQGTLTYCRTNRDVQVSEYWDVLFELLPSSYPGS